MTDPKAPGAIDQSLRKRFESAWIQGHAAPIERFLPPEEDPDYLPILEELVGIELHYAWKSWHELGQRSGTEPVAETIGGPPQVEAYLRRFPRLNRPETVLRLLEQELSARKQCGQGSSIEECRRRFPDLTIAEGQLESALPMLSECGTDAPLADTLAPGLPGGTAAKGFALGQFGNYELLEEIGRGGMGVVYRARQRSADRIVALKVIRRDRLETLPLDTQTTAVDRFRHEAQAAARLEHEHIVTVYEVGEVEGQPFFSMRYVEGRSLAEIVQAGPIENRRAAASMEPVARAVHEAHCLGILHRDLKPQNILVDAKTDRALVADFGLAKLSEGNDELTRAGEVMGTPQYMSPEQAQDSANVTAASDIYGLGATLYHILTGRPPFQAATPVETLRQVIDEEPAPPRQLNPSIDRDLETVCLKCLQKEPSRRYATAKLLADDLRRHLDGEPILARPIGALGRTWRWCRRNPVIAIWVGLAATFLVLALVATTVGYVKTSAALAKSEESLDRLDEAVDKFFGEVMDETLFNKRGMQPLRKKLLTHALPYYEQFVLEGRNDPKVQDELALAYFRMGRINELIDTPEKALDSYQSARQMQEKLLTDRPTDRECLQALGNTWNAIGVVQQRKLKRLDEAQVAFQKAIDVRTRLTKAAPDEIEFKRTLANSYMNIGLVQRERGQFERARHRFEAAQKIRKELLDQDPGDRGSGDHRLQRNLGMGYFNLANLALAQEDYAGAKKDFEDAIVAFEKLLQSDPESLDDQARLAICYRLLADLKCETGERDSAAGEYQKALMLLETLANDSPAVPGYQADLAGVHMNLGLLDCEQNRPAEALDSFQRARDILETLVKNYHEVPEYRRDYAVTLWRIGLLQADQGQVQAARDNLEKARSLLSELVVLLPKNDDYKRQRDATKAALEMLNAKRPREE